MCVWCGSVSVTMYTMTMFQNVPLEKSIKDWFPNYNLYVYGEGYVFHMMLVFVTLLAKLKYFTA